MVMVLVMVMVKTISMYTITNLYSSPSQVDVTTRAILEDVVAEDVPCGLYWHCALQLCATRPPLSLHVFLYLETFRSLVSCDLRRIGHWGYSTYGMTLGMGMGMGWGWGWWRWVLVMVPPAAPMITDAPAGSRLGRLNRINSADISGD